MATSKQTYPCFVCQKLGFDIQVYLDGKDEVGNTIRKNVDMTEHYHMTTKQQQQLQQQVEDKDNPLALVSDESVDRGINAFSMMSSLIVLVEQTQKLLVTMNTKLDRLLNLAERKP